MAETMRAAMIHGPGELRIDEVPRPAPGPGQALIRIRACEVCPSDVRSYTGSVMQPRNGSRSGLQ